MLTFKHYLFQLLMFTIDFYQILLFVFLLASFALRNPNARWFRFLAAVCEPPIDLVRRLTLNRLVIGQFDLSPLGVFLGLGLLQVTIKFLFS